MIFGVLGCIAAGILCGRFLFPAALSQNISEWVTPALLLLVFLAGIDIGANREVLQKLRRMGLRILCVPLSCVIGSLAGGCLASPILSMPLAESAAISAGMGWYTLSSVILADTVSAEAGAVAFVSNVLREMIVLLAIPLLARRVHPYSAIAAAGATAMDVSLPMITSVTDKQTMVVSIISGLVLSALVPVLVPLIYRILL